MLSVYGDVAELVDALDSKSCFLRKCEFESHHPYQNEKPWIKSKAFFVAVFAIFIEPPYRHRYKHTQPYSAG